MREYEFVGGPLHGQRRFFTDGADWFGFRYLEGEYNTRVTQTYKSDPPQLFWRLRDDPPTQPDWALDGPYGEKLDGQQG